jgi:ParB-like chromosome segregation protein Spo0J
MANSEKGPIEIRYEPLSKIVKAPRNPREHDLGAIHESIARFGFVSPIIINEKTGRLVVGHGRVDALRQLQADGTPPPDRVIRDGDEWLVPVIHGIEFADEQDAEAFLLADNRTSELSGWIESDLAAILREHAETERGLAGIGYDGDDLDEMLQRITGEGPQLSGDTQPFERDHQCPKCGHTWNGPCSPKE